MSHAEPFQFNELSPASEEFFASEIFRTYSLRLLQLANDRLGKDIRAKVSPEDIVQSAFKSFFRRLEEFRFEGEKSDAIWGLLSIITIRKCKKWDAFYRCNKRAVSREIDCNGSSGSRGHSPSSVSTEPGPEDAVVVSDLVEKLFDQFEPRQQQMLLMRIDGASVEEIALKCQSSCRTVARTIATAKQLLTEYLIDD